MKSNEILNSFKAICPSIEWDRYVDAYDELIFYGWIPRSNKQRDFLVIFFSPDANLNDVGYVTSSAKFSQAFCDLIGGVHNPCKKIFYNDISKTKNR